MSLCDIESEQISSNDIPLGLLMANHDVVVIGSGAGGAMSAHILCAAGLNVLMLEAGREYDPVAETPMFQTPADAPLRGAPTPDKDKGFYWAVVDGGYTVTDIPYTQGGEVDFKWFRTRMLGGRTNHWGRWTPRFGPYDFKGKSRDGLGEDWPVSYEDMARWYDDTETLVGVYGANTELENHPPSAPGVLHAPPAPRVYELFVKAACEELGLPIIPARRAVLTRPIDERNACFYATDCMRGCSIGAAFQTTTSLIPWARRTGRLTVQTRAQVTNLKLDKSGRPVGVRYIDLSNGQEQIVISRVVVLAASACETARILLNSRDEGSPNGAANSSGQVGKNLLDNPQSQAVTAYFPKLDGRPNYNEFGAGNAHLYAPWGGHDAQARGELDFPRGYQFMFWGGRQTPEMGLAGVADTVDGYGAPLRAAIKQRYGSMIKFVGQGEMLPSSQCYADLDPERRDRWGMPALRFHWKWANSDIAMANHMRKTMDKIIDRLGGSRVSELREGEAFLTEPGTCIHEVGTARMGPDPRQSVVNEYGQAWDAPNLFLMDGSVFPSSPCKNPTLTIMALAMRNSRYLASEIKAGRL